MRNPFRSIVVRAVEVVHACDTALRISTAGRTSPRPRRATSRPRAGVGCGATEAPRGLLWHRYATDADGIITDARIVPPTSQNQHEIEHDLAASSRPDSPSTTHALTHRCEHAIRNHDPCISCATHFLDLPWAPTPSRERAGAGARRSAASALAVPAPGSGPSARGAVAVGVGNSDGGDAASGRRSPPGSPRR